MTILNSEQTDIDTLFMLYEEATNHQKKLAPKHWQGFDRQLVEIEIAEHRQWKIVIDNEIACVFVLTFNDFQIWGEKDKDPAIYIHRIATNPKYRGLSLVKHIVAWAIDYAKSLDKQFIRMDTGSGNDKLNQYYISCGFNYLGITTLGNVDGLPKHYQNGSFSLFEIEIEAS